jgi:hypothetical protein
MTRLSNRQFPLLELFASGQHMSIEQAKVFDQRPFRSMLIHEWIEFKPARGFRITDAGRDAYEEFMHTDIGRKNPRLPLTNYFDARAYGLEEPPAKVHVMRKRRAA